MNKIKLFLCVALFGAMSFGAFSAYNHYTMSEEKRFLFANIEALTQDEGTAAAYCYVVEPFGYVENYEWFLPCDSKTSESKIYPCLKKDVWQQKKKQDRCTK